ncbi:MAG: radical SAM protein [Dehalococcoidia bacterium]|nr:radical SAM protein [Dehalococcoidia bacterium]
MTQAIVQPAASGPRRSMPDEIYLEVTNRCHLTCTTCPQSWGMSEDTADLTPETARELLSQLPTVRRVVLHGIGEPTLNPRLAEIIDVVKERGAYALFNTNALLLRGRLLETLVQSGLDEVRISVDAATPETYKLVRGTDMFSRVIANAAALNETKARLGATTPRLSLWMTGMKSNIRELPELVRVAARAGIAEVYVQRLVFSGRNLADQQEALYGQMGPPEREGLAAAERVAAELGVTLNGSSEALPAEQAPSLAERPWSACRRPTSLMYITANGNVLPCCIAPFTSAPYESLILGNTGRMGLEEIWNGNQYEEWRSKLQSDEPPQACKGCGSAWAL